MKARISARMREILEVFGPFDRVSIKKLIQKRVAAGERPAVVKASVSRTLRRLWRLGLVELHEMTSGYRFCATARRLNSQRIFETVRDDPQAAYRQYTQESSALAAMVGVRFKDHHGSAEAFLAAKERAFNEYPRMRVRYVELTAQGERAVNFHAGTRVNRKNAEGNR
jgi:hypothetical protein